MDTLLSKETPQKFTSCLIQNIEEEEDAIQDFFILILLKICTRRDLQQVMSSKLFVDF